MNAKKFFSIFICAVVVFTAIPFYSSASEAVDFIDGEVIFKYTQSIFLNEKFCSSDYITPEIEACGVLSLEELDTDQIYNTAIKTTDDLIKTKTTLFLAKTTANTQTVCEKLESVCGVEFAHPNYNLEQDDFSMPTEITSPTSTFNTYTDWWMNGIVEVPNAWQEFETFGEGVTVAVLDSGVYVQNPEIAGNIWADANGNKGFNAVTQTYDVTPDTTHGGNVIGILAGSIGNNRSCIGVAPKAKIMPIKVSSSASSLPMTAVIVGINYSIANGADIISMSLSTSNNAESFYDACKAAYDSGIIIVSSAGNNSLDALNTKRYPAAYDCVIGVMALGKEGELCSFSNYDSTNSFYEVAAPGYIILGLPSSPTAINQVTGVSGTSQATPIVAGLAALYLSIYPDHTPEEFRRALLQSSTDTCKPSSTIVTGAAYTFPVVNAMKLLSYPNTSPQVLKVEGTTTVVDQSRAYIYGLEEGYEDIEDYVTVSEGSFEFIPTENGNGTGSIFRVYSLSGEIYRDYEIVIFGDTDGDARCDGQDVIFCECIINEHPVPDSVAFAADVDFDDLVSSSDLQIIAGCGLLSDFVTQIR